jgi:enamine deaminase RidA (YjgF/YER057c/UK114 family)
VTDFELLAPTPNGYSQVARVPATSTLVYVSGQIAVAADGSVPDGWEAQTRLVMEHVATALDTGGATWHDVFKLTIFVVDLGEIGTIRRVRDTFVDPERPPTSSLVEVAGLVRPDLLIEIEAVAAVSP